MKEIESYSTESESGNDDMIKRILKRMNDAGYYFDDDGELDEAINLLKPNFYVDGVKGYFDISDSDAVYDGEHGYWLALNFHGNSSSNWALFKKKMEKIQDFQFKIVGALVKEGILEEEDLAQGSINWEGLRDGHIFINDFDKPKTKSCSHDNLGIKTMEQLNGELLLTLVCDACSKRTSTSAPIESDAWEAEDLNTWAKQELSSHGQNVSFKNWAKKEVKSHGNIDLVDWAKHEKQSHTKRKASESFSLDSKKADSINMEEPVIEEPSFIPDGDGRAIGQQNSSINLSPLHAESRFDKLSNEIADEYEEKGMSPEKAQEVGDATAAMIGRKKYGKKGMAQMQRKGMQSESNFSAEGKIKWTTSSGQTFYTTGEKVGNYGGSASSGEIAFYEGLPQLKRTLSTLSSLDDTNRGIVLGFVNEWAERGSTRNLWDACQDMWAGAKGKRHFTNETPNWKRAEGDSATYSPSSNPDMVNEIQTSPTNESPQLFNASNTFNTTTALGIGGLVVAALSLPMLYSSAKSRLGKSAEEKRKASGSVRKNHTQIKNSEYSVGQVNPVEAEGQQDIHGAEGITNPRHIPSPTPSGYPSKSLKMW